MRRKARPAAAAKAPAGAGMDPSPARPKGRSRVWRAIGEIPLLLGFAALIAFLLKTLVAQAFYIPSESMLDQLEVNDRVVVSKIAYRLHPPRRGDIVVFDCPKTACRLEPPKPSTGTGWQDRARRVLHSVGEGIGVVQPSTEEFIKRVVALPGESVEGRDGKVFVNGRRLIEPYLEAGTTTSTFAPVTVPRGRLWVMGDNRGNSSDSRVFGPITRESVVGRTVLKVWPLKSASFL
ncbi:MAG TPA: signal peptidase I [Acidimicrobiales bacterium]|nr:signal peptidase I [Acidimicrobiales bacterium]